MAAGIFLGFWVALGLGVFFVAMRGGPRGAREALHAQSGRGRRTTTTIIVAVCVVGGILVPGLVLGFNGAHKAKTGPSGITLTAGQARGRELFATRCATCHALAAAKAVGRVGPNLDTLRPPAVLVMDAMANGRARGNGQMPAQLLDGPDAHNVAAFVAAVAGH